MTAMNLASHGTQDMYPTFLQRFWKLGTTQRSLISAVSMVGAIFGGVVIGFLSDRYGRRRAMIGALVGAIVLVPLWAYAPRVAMLYVGAFFMQFCVQGAWGVIPAHLSELTPSAIRGFLPGFAYQCGALLASSVSYFEAVLAEHMSYATAMASTALTVFILAAVLTGVGREQRGVAF
jgi:SHS family lactate transporter-like MFS transporter